MSTYPEYSGSPRRPPFTQGELMEHCEAFREAKRVRTLAFPAGGEELKRAEEAYWAASLALKVLLSRVRKVDFSGWRYFLDRTGEVHCVRIPSSYRSYPDIRGPNDHRRKS